MSLIHHYGYKSAELFNWVAATGATMSQSDNQTLEVFSTDTDLEELIVKNGWYVEDAPARLLALLPADSLWGPLTAFNYKSGLMTRLDRTEVFEYGHQVRTELINSSADTVIKELSTYWPAPSAQTNSVGPYCRLMTIQWLDTAGNVCATKYRFKPYVTLASPLLKTSSESWLEYAERFNTAAATPGSLSAAGPSIAAGRRRRQNVIDELSAVIGSAILALNNSADPSTGGTAYLVSLKGADSAFLTSGSRTLHEAVADSSSVDFAWLDVPVAEGVTIQMYLLSKLAPWAP
jgi:hypothetical protein